MKRRKEKMNNFILILKREKKNIYIDINSIDKIEIFNEKNYNKIYLKNNESFIINDNITNEVVNYFNNNKNISIYIL